MSESSIKYVILAKVTPPIPKAIKLNAITRDLRFESEEQLSLKNIVIIAVTVPATPTKHEIARILKVILSTKFPIMEKITSIVLKYTQAFFLPMLSNKTLAISC